MGKERIVLRFKSDGETEGLYTDKFNLRALGNLTVERASNIEFDEVEQEWDVIDAKTKQLLFSSPSRESAIKWEINYYNQQVSEKRIT